jgi:hypothetical protein
MHEDTLEKTLWKMDLLNQAVRGIAHRGASGDIKDVDDEYMAGRGSYPRHQGRSRARYQRLRRGAQGRAGAGVTSSSSHRTGGRREQREPR